FFQAEDGIRDFHVTGVQTCALPISAGGNAGEICGLKSLDQIIRFGGLCLFDGGLQNEECIIGIAAGVVGRDTKLLYIVVVPLYRSEERRVGKERRARRSRCTYTTEP